MPSAPSATHRLMTVVHQAVDAVALALAEAGVGLGERLDPAPPPGGESLSGGLAAASVVVARQLLLARYDLAAVLCHARVEVAVGARDPVGDPQVDADRMRGMGGRGRVRHGRAHHQLHLGAKRLADHPDLRDLAARGEFLDQARLVAGIELDGSQPLDAQPPPSAPRVGRLDHRLRRVGDRDAAPAAALLEPRVAGLGARPVLALLAAVIERGAGLVEPVDHAPPDIHRQIRPQQSVPTTWGCSLRRISLNWE